jgi:predicted nucleic acid-binding protein
LDRVATRQRESNGRTRVPLASMIAATALVHGLSVITRNTADFPGIAVVDPWTANTET